MTRLFGMLRDAKIALLALALLVFSPSGPLAGQAPDFAPREQPQRLPDVSDEPRPHLPRGILAPLWPGTPHLETQEIVQPLTERDLRRLHVVHASALTATKIVDTQRANGEAASSERRNDGDGEPLAPQAEGEPLEVPPLVDESIEDEPLEEAISSFLSSYRPLFFENDFRYLRHPEVSRQYLSDSWKQMTFGDHWIVDVAGEYRVRQQNEANLRYNDLSPLDDNFLLERTRLYAHAVYAEVLGLYAEMQDGVSHWENNLPRDVEENRFDMQNLFVDGLLTSLTEGELWLRGGRQELLFGSQRLVSPVDWLNTRQTFDGVKLFYRGSSWDVDAFWTRPIDFAQQLGQDHNFNSPAGDQQFQGVYVTHRWDDEIGIDGYYLARSDGATRVFAHTVGSRAWGSHGAWRGEFEGAVQFGRAGNEDLGAGFATLAVSRELSRIPTRPTVSVGFDWASGDRDPNDGTAGTFQQLYGDFHSYLGYCDLIGRRNIQDLSVGVEWPGDEGGFLAVAWPLFQLASTTDALYNARGLPIRHDPTGASGGAVGQELDIRYRSISSPRSDWLIGYSHFYSGSFVRRTTATGEARDADFFYWQWTTRF